MWTFLHILLYLFAYFVLCDGNKTLNFFPLLSETEYVSYDGAPFTAMTTNNTVKHLDLSAPQFGLEVTQIYASVHQIIVFTGI